MSDAVEFSISYYSLVVAFLLVFPIFVKLSRFVVKKFVHLHVTVFSNLLDSLFKSQKQPENVIKHPKLVVRVYSLKERHFESVFKLSEELTSYQSSNGIIALSFFSVLLAVITSQAIYLSDFSNYLIKLIAVDGGVGNVLNLETVLFISLSSFFAFMMYVFYRDIARKIDDIPKILSIFLGLVWFGIFVLLLAFIYPIFESWAIFLANLIVSSIASIMDDGFLDLSYMSGQDLPELINIDLLVLVSILCSTFIFFHVANKSIKAVPKYNESFLVNKLFRIVFYFELLCVLIVLNSLMTFIFNNAPQLYFLGIFFIFFVSHIVGLFLFPYTLSLVISLIIKTQYVSIILHEKLFIIFDSARSFFEPKN